MTRARAVIVLILLSALGMGAGLYYAQVYGFYREVGATDAAAVAVRRADGGEEALPFADYRGIDSDSSPIRFRACFRVTAPREAVEAVAVPYPEADPLVAPRWFDCFDAEAIGLALAAGQARAFQGVGKGRYGIDRVLAVMPTGQGWAWDQLNACGVAAYSGDAPPEGCAPPPADLRLDFPPTDTPPDPAGET